jgi:glyoxylase-like metal-dependent hydrolase (beta-lactamase superfamily II)
LAISPPAPTLYLIESVWLDDCCCSTSGPGIIGPTRRPSTALRSLVVETARSIVVIEVGLGLFDWLAPTRRLGLARSRRMPPIGRRRVLRQQLENRGLCPDRVEHIVLSHVHKDNIGGLSDFPGASVHAWQSPSVDDLLVATARRAPQVAHGLRYVPPSPVTSDWYGWKIRQLAIDELEIHLIELPGHAPGHAGVLLRYAGGFVVYLGQALTSLEELRVPAAPLDLRRGWRIMQDAQPFESLITRERLRRLIRRPPATLTFVAAHGPTARISVGPTPYPRIGYL